MFNKRRQMFIPDSESESERFLPLSYRDSFLGVLEDPWTSVDLDDPQHEERELQSGRFRCDINWLNIQDGAPQI